MWMNWHGATHWLDCVTEGLQGTLPGMNGGLLNCRNDTCQAHIGFHPFVLHEIAELAHPPQTCRQRLHQCPGRISGIVG